MADTPQTSARPLIASAPLSEFGDLYTSEAFHDPFVMDRDQTYVPGWSELRRARDIALGQYANRAIAASQVPTLPVNLRWARAQSKAGAPDSAKQFAHSRKGYRLANATEDLGQPWLRALPPGAMIQADDTIRTGDSVLMVADQQSAARNAAIKARLVEQRLTGVPHMFAQTMEREVGPEKAQKAAPSITKEGKK